MSHPLQPDEEAIDFRAECFQKLKSLCADTHDKDYKAKRTGGGRCACGRMSGTSYACTALRDLLEVTALAYYHLNQDDRLSEPEKTLIDQVFWNLQYHG